MVRSLIKQFVPNHLVNYFTSGHERSVKTKRNILASFFIKGFNIIIYLALVPITLQFVNTTNYGIWLTLSTIISWASFFDLGFGNGLRNRYTEAISKGKYKLARIYVSTTYAILSLVIIIVFLIFILINFFLDWSEILNSDSKSGSVLSILAVIVFAFFCIQFVFQLILTILLADQRPAIAGFISMSGNLLALLIIFFLSKITQGSLIYLSIVMGGAPVLVLIIFNIYLFKNDFKKYRPSLKYVKFSFAKDLMSLGGQFFIIQIVYLIIFTTSNLIISQLFGPAKVVVFNIVMRYFNVTITLFNILLLPFWSAFTEAYCKLDYQWIRKSINNLIKIWIIFLIITIAMIFSSHFVYEIWVGGQIVVPFSLTVLMGLYAIITNWNSIFAYFLNGIGKIRIQFYYSILLGLITIPLTLYLGRKIGLEGVILSTCIILFINSLFAPVQYLKIITGSANGIWLK